jgi:hypothetical protein
MFAILGTEVDDALAIAEQLTSEVPGQSGHALPEQHRQICAKGLNRSRGRALRQAAAAVQ